MKTRTRVFAVLFVLAGSIGIIFGFYRFMNNRYNYTALTDWVLSSDEEDTTERHRQNIQESYQILSNHILIRPDWGDNAGKLVRMNRSGLRQDTVISDSVHTFLSWNYKIYYDVVDDYPDDDGKVRIYCYDNGTKETSLLMEEKNIIWFSIYEDQIVYAREDRDGALESIGLCDLDGKNRRDIYHLKEENTLFLVENVFLTGDTILFLGQPDIDEDKAELAMLSLKTGKQKRVLALGESGSILEDIGFYLENILYVALDDGFYQITLDTEKFQASGKKLFDDLFIDTIYCRENKLYHFDSNDNFTMISDD